MDSFEYRKELAKRVDALAVVHEYETGSPLKFATLQAELEKSGVSISRQRWSYIRHGSGAAVRDPEVLAAIATYFGEDAAYLTDLTTPPTEEFERRVDHVVRLRRANVKKIAARSLGRLDPELAESLIRVIEESTDPGDARRL